MGWVWADESGAARSCDVGEFDNSNPRSSDRCSSRKILKSQCRTEEVEPGKFVRKCEKTEQILRDCVGRPSEVVQFNEEFTEEDVSDQMKKGSDVDGPFDFPGLRSDIEGIERNIFGGLGRFFEAAEEMRNGFFSVFGSPHADSSSSRRRGIRVDEHQSKESSSKLNSTESGHVDISALARDV